MTRLLTLQDDSGGFDFVGNAFKITGTVADIDDLKEALTSNIFFGLFCFGTALAMTKIEPSDRLFKMCCEFMVVRSCAILCLS